MLGLKSSHIRPRGTLNLQRHLQRHPQRCAPNGIRTRAATLKGWCFFLTGRRKSTDQFVLLVTKMLARSTKGIKKLRVVHEWMFQDEIGRTSDEFDLRYRRAGSGDSSDLLAGYSAKEGLFCRVTPLLCQRQKRAPMAELIMLKFDSPYGAQGALSDVRALEELHHAWLDDVATVEKHKGGFVALHTPHGSAL